MYQQLECLFFSCQGCIFHDYNHAPSGYTAHFRHEIHLYRDWIRFSNILIEFEIPNGKYVLGDAGFRLSSLCLTPYRGVALVVRLSGKNRFQ